MHLEGVPAITSVAGTTTFVPAASKAPNTGISMESIVRAISDIPFAEYKKAGVNLLRGASAAKALFQGARAGNLLTL
jgi:hypothetical protein